jgi:hypothetical protein
MRHRAAWVLFIASTSAATPFAIRPLLAAEAYCPNPAHATPAEVPADLTAAVAKAFNVQAGDLNGAAYVRCVGPVLMGCYVGANLICDKADTRRLLPGASAWCHDNPGSKFIPMAATGHATIYNWSCKGTRAVAGKPLVAVDPQGYIADNWKKIP